MIFQKKGIWILLAVAIVLSFSALSLATDQDKININTATVEQLASLEKVGEAYAKRIVEYREANGPFEKPEDIMKVKGIGEKTWEANKDKISVGQ